MVINCRERCNHSQLFNISTISLIFIYCFGYSLRTILTWALDKVSHRYGELMSRLIHLHFHLINSSKVLKVTNHEEEDCRRQSTYIKSINNEDNDSLIVGIQ